MQHLDRPRRGAGGDCSSRGGALPIRDAAGAARPAAAVPRHGGGRQRRPDRGDRRLRRRRRSAAPGPAGRALIENPAARQAAGSVSHRYRDRDPSRRWGVRRPLWRADSVRQRYLAGTNVLRTVARFGADRATIAARSEGRTAARAERRWVARAARPLRRGRPGLGAADVRALAAGPAGADRPPHWRRRRRSPRRLGLRLAARRGAVALALAAAGYRGEARRMARFLLGLDLDPPPASAERRPGRRRGRRGRRLGLGRRRRRATGLRRPAAARVAGPHRLPGGEGGDFLANAIASGVSAARSGRSSRPGGGWCAGRRPRRPASTRPPPGRCGPSPARPSTRGPPLAARLAARGRASASSPPKTGRAATRGRRRRPGAPGAWRRSASGGRPSPHGRPAPRRDPGRSAPRAGRRPHRHPRSTTPLAWSHAFAILALRQLWPS